MAAMATSFSLLDLVLTAVAASIFCVADAQVDKDEWLKGHNNARAAVGVPALNWNTTAYNYALGYANSQKGQCPSLKHSQSKTYGENLAWSSYPNASPTTVVRDQWVGEEKPYYNYTTNTCKAGEVCGHYTQVVWAKTTSVGCAKVNCTSNAKGVYFICNYYPPGNYIGKRPY